MLIAILNEKGGVGKTTLATKDLHMRAVRPTKETQGEDARLAQQKKAVEGFERLHVQITQQQYQQLKRIAFERNARLAEVVREALGDWLAKRS